MGFKSLLTILNNNFPKSNLIDLTNKNITELTVGIDAQSLLFHGLYNDNIEEMETIEKQLEILSTWLLKNMLSDFTRCHVNAGKPKRGILVISFDGKSPIMKQKRQLQRRQTNVNFYQDNNEIVDSIKEHVRKNIYNHGIYIDMLYNIMYRQLNDQSFMLNMFSEFEPDSYGIDNESFLFPNDTIIKIVLSGPNETGEGEQKLLKYLTLDKLNEDITRSLIIISSDSDLYVMMLAKYEKLVKIYTHVHLQFVYAPYKNPIFNISKHYDILGCKNQTILKAWIITFHLLGNDFIPPILHLQSKNKMVSKRFLVISKSEIDKISNDFSTTQFTVKLVNKLIENKLIQYREKQNIDVIEDAKIAWSNYLKVLYWSCDYFTLNFNESINIINPISDVLDCKLRELVLYSIHNNIPSCVNKTNLLTHDVKQIFYDYFIYNFIPYG
jgi:XRN 5'-3' exonuclease N-terminus